MQSLAVGVHDWPAFAPKEGYYPEDLPPEWRLGYYANEFNSVCIPLSALPEEKDERAEWLDSLPAGFRLSLQATGNTDLSRLPRADEIGDAIPAWLLLPPGLEMPRTEWRRLGTGIWRPGSDTASPVALLPADPDPASQRQHIDSWLACPSSVGATDLWLESGADAASLSALRQLVELMGL